MDAEIHTLFREAQKGNRTSLDQFLKRFSVYIDAHCRKFNYKNWEDIRQETYITCIRCIKDVQSPLAFPNWVKTVILNISSRKKSERILFQVPEDFEKEFIPEDIYENEEYLNLIRSDLIQAIRKLAPGQQDVMALGLLGLTPKKIAQIFEINHGTTKRRMFDGRNNLRKHLEKYEEKLCS